MCVPPTFVCPPTVSPSTFHQYPPTSHPSQFGSDSEVVEGSFSYRTPEGQEVAVEYTADENGYFPRGVGIHPALARALEHLKRQNGI